jgi:hypothetical protein
MRRPDPAVLVVIAFTVLALVVLLLVVSTAPAKSETPHAYRPLPAALFSRWPAVPVDAGALGAMVTTPEPRIESSPSILPSGRPSANPRLTTPKLAVPRPTARPTGAIGTAYVGAKGLAGVATYQPLPGLFGSAGPVLRALGLHAGQRVHVCNNSKTFRACIDVVIWPGGCWCRVRPGGPTLLDLSVAAFADLAPLSQGVVPITVEW